jgi:hypothetical protein
VGLLEDEHSKANYSIINIEESFLQLHESTAEIYVGL